MCISSMQIFNKNTIQEKPPDCSKQNKKNKKNLKEFATRGTSKQAINNQSNPTLNKLSGTDAKSTKHKSERESPSKLQTLSKVEFLNVDYLSKKSKQHKDIEKVVVDVDNDIPFKQVRSKRKKLSKSADKIENVIEPNKEKPPTNNTSSSCEQKSETLNIHKSRSLPSFPKSTERRANTKRAEKEDSKAELLQFNYTKSSQGVKPTIKDSLKLNEPKLLNHKHTSIDNSHHKLESNFKDLTSKTPQLKDQLEKKSITVNPSKFAQAERSEPIVGNKQNSHNQQIVKRASPEVSSSVLNIEINKPHLLNKEVQVNKINKSTVDQDSSKVRQIEISKKELLINEQTGNKSTYENSFKVTKNKGTKDCSIEFSNDQQLKTKKLTDTETIKSEVDSKGFKSNQEEINKEVKPESASLQKQFITKKQVSISNEPLEVVKQSKLRKVQSETAIIVKKLPDQYTQNNSVQKEEKATGQEVKPKIDFNKEIKQIDNIVEKERENILGLNLELNNKPVYAAAIAEQKTNKTTIDQDNTESRQHKQEKNKLKSDIGYLVKQIDSKYSFNTEEFTKQQNLLPDAQEQIFKSHNNDVFKKENLSVLPDSARNLNITTESFADTIEIEPVKRVEQSKIITKTVDNFPASEIIEHFKLKHKGPIVPNLKGVLLESPTGVTPIFNSNTSTLVSKAIKSPITNSLASLNPKPSVEDKNLLSISPIIAQDYTTMKINTQVRVLSLNDNEHQESTLYRIEKNWIIQFRLGSSLLGRKVCLYCNYPEQKNVIHTEFDRNKYYLLPWNQDAGCCNSDDTALFAELSVKIAGNFHYYFLYENATESGPQGSGFFLVDPVLQYGNQEKLPLNGIQCQTVLSKCLGPLSTWENKLRVSKESGYNMIHFTPIQELGKSNSAYSLSGQLKLNPTFNENGTSVSFEDIDKLISKMRKDWKVLSICDIVLNHTANETDWLQEHPEGTYNCFTCPYMRPAYLLDAALNKFSEDVKNGFYESMGIPPEVSSEDHLNSIRYSVNTKVLKEINIPEMYICDVNKLVSQFQELCRKQPPATPATIRKTDEKLKLIQDPTYSRFSSTVDMNLAIKLFNIYRQDSFDEEARIKRCSEQFKNHLDGLNNDITNEINGHLSAALENVIAGIRYFRVQHDGPRIKEISINNPLCSRYFTDYGEPKTMKEYEAIMYSTNSKYLMAHNGWVMNSDPMRNFADADSNIYIRRELIAWGDSVKLRYGDKPEDCPFLWNHMKNYVELTAKIFDGVRLDNCHSTPIPVAVYLLDCARRVRPDLYVVAELFTNSDNTDNIFVNRLGITSLIREAMSAWDPHEEGRLVYRYGGDPVGAFFQPHTRPLAPSIAHALFLDLTHDNPSPIEKRSVFDLLPSSALVNMACCASGSNRGYDELVNHHIHVVDETRQYTEWTNDADVALESPHYVSYNSGIISAKKCINELHFKLGVEGFSQVYVDQIDPNIVAVTRHCPQTHESVILVAFTAFSQPNINEANYQRGIKPLRVEGVLDEIILEATLSHVNTGKGGSKYAHHEKFVQDQKWINGLGEYRADVKKHIQLNDSDVFEEGNSGDPNITQLNFKNFKPGSVVAIRVSLQKHVQDSISKLRDMMSALSRKNNTDLLNIVNKLNLADLNRALYRCDQEERDEGNGFSTYNIPNFGSLVYCGLQGFISLLSTIRLENDLGHPMCGNLRDGNWLIDYMCQRLKLDDGTKQLGQWIDKSTEPLKSIPRYLIPSYFDMIVTSLYMVLLEQSYQLMSDFVKNGSTFVKGLCLGSLQFAAIIKSADLPLLSPNLALPRPPTKLNNHGKMVQTCVTLSAGLPHFSTGYMRNWGRDTFIALRGLFILTGRYEDARYHILGYAACLRHGLIPNLLDAGKNSRFNCRDAIWWWLYCIKSYVDEVPDGVKILSDKVSRIFPTDDSPAIEPGIVDQPLCEVIQESLRCHFQGLAFRERNAGRQIDAHMTDKGFNNQIGVHPETGFVFGGNEFNCGTWMDKMGSSDKAGNRGKPATPRDGSAIELIGLSKAVVMWLSRLHEVNQYPYGGVERINKNGDITKWTFNEWSEKIKSNFEQYFWIDTSPSSGEVRPDLVNKRGIYKDSYGATQEWADFQLRCNFPIAMVAAPELFDPKHAWIALQNAEKHLLGPLGMKTLDPDDWAYCGDYNNADDSTNLKTAHGFNYHQGPEWVWPVGYYLRAKLHFASENGELSRTLANVKVILSKHFTELQTSSWRGLPELTNSNGSFCNDSSRTQAWSMSCILEVLHDLQQIELRQHQLKSN